VGSHFVGYAATTTLACIQTSPIDFEGHEECLRVLRQKELEKSRLETEVDALRVVAPLLSEDGGAENDNHPILRRVVNENPQPDHSAWQGRAKES
jgi:hypothetical protein